VDIGGARVVPNATLADVGIDDAGRVLLLYDRAHNAPGGKAIRRSSTGRWGKPQHVGGGEMAVGAGGAAVVAYSRASRRPDQPAASDGREHDTEPDNDASRAGAQSLFTQRMSPSGR
jgi:hypothetical protein